MKTVFFILTFFVHIMTFGQYHNIQVNQNITVQGESVTNCYVVIDDVTVASVKTLVAGVRVSIYKTKSKYQTNPDWTIQADQISIILVTIPPTGDIYDNIILVTIPPTGDIYDNISDGLKAKLLELNPTWTANNLIIEP